MHEGSVPGSPLRRLAKGSQEGSGRGALDRAKRLNAEVDQLYQRALQIREQALGPTHRDVAQSLNNLANLLQAMGDYAGARPLHERALRIWEQALGPTHPEVAQSLNNL